MSANQLGGKETAEQWMAGIAAFTLVRIGTPPANEREWAEFGGDNIWRNVGSVVRQLDLLADYASRHHPDLDCDLLRAGSEWALRLITTVPDVISELVSRLEKPRA